MPSIKSPLFFRKPYTKNPYMPFMKSPLFFCETLPQEPYIYSKKALYSTAKKSCILSPCTKRQISSQTPLCISSRSINWAPQSKTAQRILMSVLFVCRYVCTSMCLYMYFFPLNMQCKEYTFSYVEFNESCAL